MNFLALLNTVTQAPAGTTTATQAAGDAATSSSGMPIVSLALYVVFFIGVMYFMVVRPQKKRQKSLENMMTTIKAGDWVMTNTGFYGKVADITEECFVIEFGTNKGVKIPVRKTEIAGVKEPNLTTKKIEETTQQ